MRSCASGYRTARDRAVELPPRFAGRPVRLAVGVQKLARLRMPTKRLKYGRSHELVSQQERSQFVRLPSAKITVRETSRRGPGGAPDGARRRADGPAVSSVWLRMSGSRVGHDRHPIDIVCHGG